MLEAHAGPRACRRPHDAAAGHGQGELREDRRTSPGRSSCSCSGTCSARPTSAFKGWDIGDIVGAEGTLFRTKTGELSVRVDELRLLAKSLRPLPEKWHGLADIEARYRQRYVDLIMNERAATCFVTRTRIVRFLRTCSMRSASSKSRRR